LDADVDAALEELLGEESERAFDLVDSGGAGRVMPSGS
jgi:hypothetical protein